jgi:Holliday junction resolvasome RuvABC endonuclease subunit
MLEVVNLGDRFINILGIDPGTQTLGTAIITVDLNDFTIVQTQAQTFTASRFIQHDEKYIDYHGDRAYRLMRHGENLVHLFYKHTPAYIVSESPFYSQRMPSAFSALIEVINVINTSVYQYSPYMQLNLVDPPTAKKAVGAPGNADKKVMKEKIITLPDLHYQSYPAIELLDEHSIDAIAVAYSLYKKIIL